MYGRPGLEIYTTQSDAARDQDESRHLKRYNHANSPRNQPTLINQHNKLQF